MKRGKGFFSKIIPGRLFNSLRGKKSDWHILSGYIIGDVHRNTTVHVSPDASIAGDIYAPRVVVSGLVYGFIMCRELIIEPEGQVWGDVITVSYQVLPRGKIHGWISTLDEGTVGLLMTGEIVPADINLDPPELPDGKSISDFDGARITNREEHHIYRQLRSETAASLLARRELELAFEKRLRETIKHKSPGGTEASEANIENLHAKAEEKEADGLTSADAIRIQDLEDSLNRMKGMLSQVANLAYELQLKYLWAKANLESTRKATIQRRTIPSGAAITGKLKSEEQDSSSALQDWQSTIESLRTEIVKQRLVHYQTKRQLERKTKELNDYKSLAQRRIKNLEILLAKGSVPSD